MDTAPYMTETKQLADKSGNIFVEPPDEAAVQEIIEKRVDMAMLLAGYRAYETWCERDPEGEDVGDLVRSVYAWMQAQLEREMEQISQGA